MKRYKQLFKQAYQHTQPVQNPAGAQVVKQDSIYNDAPYLSKTLQKAMRKRYAMLLARAYKKATGRNLADPQNYVRPTFNYAIGSTANVTPAMLTRLKPQDARMLDAKSTTVWDITPGTIADAVNMYNSLKGKYRPLKQFKRVQGPFLQLSADPPEVVDKYVW